MIKILSIFLLISIMINQAQAIMSSKERNVLTNIDKNPVCQNILEKDIPTIFIPWILASWYSEEGYKESGNNIKRWIPDPITHSYDTLIYTFKKNWYKIKDVFYKDEFTLSIDGKNPQWWLYVFGYDWKKDNKITATLLTQLIWLILRDYERENWCNIWKVNIVAHSMWWLVARAMLEDMCLEIKSKDWIKFIDWISINNPVKWKIANIPIVKCNNPYNSKSISKEIKVNKFVTIATPHRWSPKAFAIWEKWDIEMTDWFIQWYVWVKGQLGVSTDLWLYKMLHWYDAKIPNWVIALWQLLPDVQKENNYNNKNLWYLLKDNPTEPTLTSNPYLKYFVPAANYPKNSFLEELNKTENINKMFNKLDKKYISYYSTITGNHGNNNIIWYELWNEPITQKTLTWPKIIDIIYDKTYNHSWQDIYDNYKKDIWKDYYMINNTIRNEYWLWWDWTVPTNNLLLVPNDSYDWKEISNPKFQTGFIDCSNALYKWFWPSWKNEWCSHSKMPFITSISVVNFLLDKWSTRQNDRVQLLSNFWKATYLEEYYWYTWDEKSSYLWGIKNTNLLSDFFEEKSDIPSLSVKTPYYTNVHKEYVKTKYKKILNKNQIELDLNLISPLKFSLDFSADDTVKSAINWWIETIDSLTMYDILSPIDIMITDEQGKRIWIDRDTWMIINEIPWAWTSWRAGESGEREFFLIPAKKWEPVNHKIETNSTWEGEYHIVLSGYDYEWNITNSGVTIAWNAKLWFNENYEVVSTSTWSNYIDLNSSLPLTLDVTKEFKTEVEKLDIRYNVKWQGRENVERIRYKLSKETSSGSQYSEIQGRFPSAREWQIYVGEEKIDWILELSVKGTWVHNLVLELLDKDDKILKSETVKIEKLEIAKEEAQISKNILHAMFFKNIDLNLFSTNSWIISTNYNFKVITDQNKQNISILKADWTNTKFSIDNDFKYKSDNDNWLEVIKVDSMNVTFKETFKDLKTEKIYTYNLILDRIEKVDITKWKKIENLFFNYDINRNIREISSNNNVLKFVYDDYIWKLKNISDLYENNIEFNYENWELWDVKINNEVVNQAITDLVRLDFKTIFSIKYKNKLEAIKTKLQNQKLDEKKKLKLIKSLEKSKEKYLKISKQEITKKEIEYLVEEIKKILENLN